MTRPRPSVFMVVNPHGIDPWSYGYLTLWVYVCPIVGIDLEGWPKTGTSRDCVRAF